MYSLRITRKGRKRKRWNLGEFEGKPCIYHNALKSIMELQEFSHHNNSELLIQYPGLEF
jgi:hypothetical protein